MPTEGPGAWTGEAHRRELEPKRSRRVVAMVVAESAFLGLYHKAGLVAAVGRREYLGGRVVFLSVFGRGSSPVDVQAGPRAVR